MDPDIILDALFFACAAVALREAVRWRRLARQHEASAHEAVSVATRAEAEAARAGEAYREVRARLDALTRYNGLRIEHEGQKGHIVSATVLGWYMDRDKPHLTIRTDAALGRPSISYGVAFDQCRFTGKG